MKLARIALLFVTIMTLVLAACAPDPSAATINPPLPPDGQVYAAHLGTTLYWLNQAVTGGTGTYILTNGENYLFAWGTPGGGVGFTMMRNAIQSGGEVMFETPISGWLKATFGRGTIANYKDMAALVQYLESDGWKVVPASSVPALLKQAITRAYTLFVEAGKSAVSVMLNSGDLISIFVMPVTVKPSDVFGENPYDIYQDGME
jgi:hypothetical protein